MWERQTNIGRVHSFFLRLIWLGIVCQGLNCDWLGWSDQGILHSPKQSRWEESNKQNMFSNVSHDWNISTISVPYKSSRKWSLIGRPDLETVTGAISSSSLSEKASPESVSYSSGGGRTSATATATRQTSTNVTCGAFPPSDVAWMNRSSYFSSSSMVKTICSSVLRSL